VGIGGRAAKENLNSDTASIPSAIYMKINDRNSPNSGKLHSYLLNSGTFSGGSAPRCGRSWEWGERPRTSMGEKPKQQHSQHTPGDLYENKRPKLAE
jgi:hypothetical protein